MHRSLYVLLLCVCLSSVSALGLLKHRSIVTATPFTHSTPVISTNRTELPPYSTVYYFDQLVDHKNLARGTFKQRYWFTSEFHQPGGPIILWTPGEQDADGFYKYLGNKSLFGLIAQQQHGCTVIIEHRFFGLSNPAPNLSIESLQVLTVQQAIDDLEYFAKTVTLPMPDGDKVGPGKAPWILVGRSYSGALVSWTMVNKPGVFFAGYATSAVVEAIVDFWEYFNIIREHMPANCSADVQAAISLVDETFTSGNATAIQTLKESFNMGDVSHLEDVASALQLNLEDWQSLDVTSGPHAQFYNFCDALEVKGGVQAPANGWGGEHAVNAWGSYWRDFYFEQVCGNTGAEECLGTYNASSPAFTNITINNWARSWQWIICHELGYFPERAPPGTPTLVSRLLGRPYNIHICEQYFPGVFTNNSIPTADDTNKKYGGWDAHVEHIIFANGLNDPWRDATVSAEGRSVISTPLRPIVMSDGFHGSDWYSAAAIDSTVFAVQNQVLASMKQWLETWEAAA